MKKVILTIMLCGILIFSMLGCAKDETSLEDLNDINNKIVAYFQTNGAQKYENYSYNYVDEENRLIVVGLIDNSKKQQEWFKKNIVNSKYIKFEQARRLNDLDVSNNINTIINSGPQASSNPFDYVKASQKEYDALLRYPKETFEYSIKDLIETNASNGLKSYIEALLCSEINKNFQYDFESAIDYLSHYKEFLNGNSNFNQFDEYAKSLIK